MKELSSKKNFDMIRKRSEIRKKNIEEQEKKRIKLLRMAYRKKQTKLM